MLFRDRFGPAVYREVVKGIPPPDELTLKELNAKASSDASGTDLPNRDAEIINFGQPRSDAKSKLVEPEGTEDAPKQD
jgi:hypothetical protein